MRRKRPVTIPPEIQGELDQTPEWWTRAFNELRRVAFETKPFDPDEHDGHELIEFHTFGSAPVVYCQECPSVEIPRRG